MKQLLQNQNIFEKLQRNLNECLKGFNEKYEGLNEAQRERMIKEKNKIYNHPSNQSDMFSAQIQGYDIQKQQVTITDGTIKYTVFIRDISVFDKANFFDTPHNSLVVVRKWSYEVAYEYDLFQINLVIDEMRCIDIITTIFYCEVKIDFTSGYTGISQCSSISSLIKDYSLLYFKALQLLKQFLIHDTFLTDYYNSTRTKSQPKLFMLSTIKNKSTQQDNDDFLIENGSLLRQIKLSLKFNQNKQNNQNLKLENNSVIIKNKKRTLPSNHQENLPIISLQKQQKLFYETEDNSEIKQQQNQCIGIQDIQYDQKNNILNNQLIYDNKSNIPIDYNNIQKEKVQQEMNQSNLLLQNVDQGQIKQFNKEQNIFQRQKMDVEEDNYINQNQTTKNYQKPTSIQSTDIQQNQIVNDNNDNIINSNSSQQNQTPCLKIFESKLSSQCQQSYQQSFLLVSGDKTSSQQDKDILSINENKSSLSYFSSDNKHSQPNNPSQINNSQQVVKLRKSQLEQSKS